jgi:hypothetical protein
MLGREVNADHLRPRMQGGHSDGRATLATAQVAIGECLREVRRVVAQKRRGGGYV